MIQPTTANATQTPLPQDATQSHSAWGRKWENVLKDENVFALSCFNSGALFATLIANVFVWMIPPDQVVTVKEVKIFSFGTALFPVLTILITIAVACRHFCRQQHEGYEPIA